MLARAIIARVVIARASLRYEIRGAKMLMALTFCGAGIIARVKCLLLLALLLALIACAGHCSRDQCSRYCSR